MSEDLSARDFEFWRAGLATGCDVVVRMVEGCIDPGARARLLGWRDEMLRWSHNDASPGWQPPPAFHLARAISDPAIPHPPPRLPRPSLHDLAPHAPAIDLQILAAREAAKPAPEPLAVSERPAGGKTALQLLRERGVYVEDSERP